MCVWVHVLHAIVAANLLVAVGTLMYHIFAGIHTEWDQAAAQPASEKVNS